MKSLRICVLAAASSLAVSNSKSFAAVLFSDTGDSTANFNVLGDIDSKAVSINYSGLGIPEAPGSLGGAATTGIQLAANKNDKVQGTAGVNVMLGSGPTSFSGSRTLQFYVWMNVPSGATNTTENFLAGAGRTASSLGTVMDDSNAASGSGSWFSMSGDNGLPSDLQQFNGHNVDVQYDDTQMATKENSAFTNKLGGANAAPANQWVKVDVVLDTAGARESIYFNDVLFSSDATTANAGYDWIGYEDPLRDVGSPVSMSGIFDNITVTPGLPDPTGLTWLAAGGLMLARRRRTR